MAFRGVDVTFTDCLFSVYDANDRCTVTVTVAATDNTWSLTAEFSESRMLPLQPRDTQNGAMRIGAVTFDLTTCSTVSSTGTIRLASGDRIGTETDRTSCLRYANRRPSGILSITECPLVRLTTEGLVCTLMADGDATISASYHAVIDGATESLGQTVR